MSTTPALRILVVSPVFPFPASWGFVKRVHHLTDALAARHDVTMLTYVGPDDSAADQKRYRLGPLTVVTVPSPKVEGLRKRLRQATSLVSRTPFHAGSLRTAALQEALDNLLASGSFDVVVLESSQLGWLRVEGAPVVVDEHNIESELLGRMAATESSRLRRGFNHWEHVRYRTFEDSVWSALDGCATTSERDAQAVRERCPGLAVTVVPNGVDPGEFAPTGTPVTPDSVVFTGLLRYRPNVDGIVWFLDEVWPAVQAQRPSAQLTIVGDGPEELLATLRRPGVTVTGWVTDVKPYLDAAAVAVVPLRMGGGTRLKVVEAMSMGKAIVSTSLGSEGLDVTSGKHLELVDDPDSFADAVVSLLGDAERGRSLGVDARALVEERYSWTRSTRTLEGLLVQVAAPGPAVSDTDGSVERRR